MKPDLATMSPQEKRELLARLLAEREAPPPVAITDIEPARILRARMSVVEQWVRRWPFFVAHEGCTRARATIGGDAKISFSTYNYLGLSGHPKVSQAAKDAIDRFGTSPSASRIASGERPVHGALEASIAGMVGTEDAIVFVSGHATNVTAIGHLMGPGDLVLYDSLAHNSILEGVRLSGARARAFRHGDMDHLRSLLQAERSRARNVLLVTEGVFSMDGDAPDLQTLVVLRREFHTWLMVDEAHSIGVVGATGRGIGEHFGIDPTDVDLWMGTLSKAFASCGGYIAGRSELIRFLKYTAPGFIYSVGISPPLAAASLAAIEVMLDEPQRVARLRANAQRFRDGARLAGLDVGLATVGAVVPIIVGSSHRAIELSQLLFERGINVEPVVAPAVEQDKSRLRFFLSSEHSTEQIDRALEALSASIDRLPARVDVGGVSRSRLPAAAGRAEKVTDPSLVHPRRARVEDPAFDPVVEAANAAVVREQYRLQSHALAKGCVARYVLPHGARVVVAGPRGNTADAPWFMHRWQLADGRVQGARELADGRAEPTATEKSNADRSRALYRHFAGSSDLEAFLSRCDPKIRWTVPGPSELFFTGEWHGRDGVLEFWQRLATRMDIHTYWLDAVLPVADHVYIVGGFHSTSLEHQIAYADPFLHRATYRNGLLVAFHETFDPVITLAAFRPDLFGPNEAGAA